MDKISILSKYMPAAAAPLVAKWIDYFKCEFKVSRNRNSKFGDYRHPFAGKGHRISVNYDLNPYAFLITTVHEFAHLQTWNEHKNQVKPHGTEWKANFKLMMRRFFDLKIFPFDVERAIIQYLENPAASSCSDLNLFRVLKKYDQKVSNAITVEKLAANTLFSTKNGRVFKKLGLVRKRYQCLEVKTGLMYLFNPLAEVYPVSA
ncbi:sprT domain-containing protein [Pedobacter sp. HMF7647]|uniref:SprT domain-containing protein n=1 Tax=Hufsiella arboris TaxID=2695275 RepID=A0A7K1YBM0_9SPHI|nr:sprT domain-containing protein [Hufsiella arboris]MXV51761.1 sprT domain-containing protein [Hufsiella arboris]